MTARDGSVSRKWTGKLPSYLLIGLSLCLPAVLVLHSVLTGRELAEMRSILLRDRAAGVAARLETIPPEQVAAGDFDALLDTDPALVQIRVFRPSDPATDPPVAAIRSGRELYHTEEAGSGAGAVMRAYIPFHSGGEVAVARIDLSRSAPDIVMSHARHNALMAILSGSLLLLLSLFAIWTMRRASRLERRRLETERLAQLGTLSAVLAHEIRNPLGTIKGFAQIARESAPPAAIKPLDAIVRESRRLEALVEALLLYGRPVEPQARPVEWSALADDVAAHARQWIGARPVEFSAGSSLSALHTDADLLKQALLNLVRNSVEAIPESQPGRVTMRAEAGPDGAARIVVEDDGPGIPETVRANLFTPFVTTKASGTGLGLSISKKLVETLGGSLRLQNIEPHGARAELELYGADSRS